MEGLVVLPPTLLDLEGPVKQAVYKSAGKDKSAGKEAASTTPLVIFATAGSKGVIRVWSTRRPHPLHSLEPLTALSTSGLKRAEEEGEGPVEAEVTVMYTGLHYDKFLDILAAVTYDQNIVFFNGQHFTLLKQVSGPLLLLHPLVSQI